MSEKEKTTENTEDTEKSRRKIRKSKRHRTLSISNEKSALKICFSESHLPAEVGTKKAHAKARRRKGKRSRISAENIAWHVHRDRLVVLGDISITLVLQLFSLRLRAFA